MFLVAGLGNPEKKYDNTRHNIGFEAAKLFADRQNISLNKQKFKAIVGEGYVGSQKVIVALPQTYMNLSGESISAILNFYKMDPTTQLIVIYDDITLAPGKLRVRKKGSAGGHNGIKNIIARTGTQDFMRIRIGVGEKPADWDLVDYVLGHFSKEDRKLVEEAMEAAADAAAMMVLGEVDRAMNEYN